VCGIVERRNRLIFRQALFFEYLKDLFEWTAGLPRKIVDEKSSRTQPEADDGFTRQR
jgi:hypothetical protein